MLPFPVGAGPWSYRVIIFNWPPCSTLRLKIALEPTRAALTWNPLKEPLVTYSRAMVVKKKGVKDGTITPEGGGTSFFRIWLSSRHLGPSCLFYMPIMIQRLMAKVLILFFLGEGPSHIILTSEENDARVESTKVSDWIISEEVCPSSNNLECHAIHLFRVCWSADKEEGFGVDLFANLFFLPVCNIRIFRLT